MQFVTILQNICNFLWKGKSYIFMALVYLWGRKAAKQEDRIREQEDALKDQEKAAQTMQAMQEAAIKAPASREELLASLKQGRF